MSKITKLVHQLVLFSTLIALCFILYVFFQIPRVIALREEQHFFEVKKGEIPPTSPPNWLERLIFLYVLQLLIFYGLAWIGEFLRFGPPAVSTSSPKLGHIWILIQVHSRSYISNPSPNVSRLTELERFLSVSSGVNDFNVWRKEMKNKVIKK